MTEQHKKEFDEAIEAIKLAYFKLNTMSVDASVALKVAYDTWVQTKPIVVNQGFPWTPYHTPMRLDDGIIGPGSAPPPPAPFETICKAQG